MTTCSRCASKPLLSSDSSVPVLVLVPDPERGPRSLYPKRTMYICKKPLVSSDSSVMDANEYPTRGVFPKSQPTRGISVAPVRGDHSQKQRLFIHAYTHVIPTREPKRCPNSRNQRQQTKTTATAKNNGFGLALARTSQSSSNAAPEPTVNTHIKTVGFGCNTPNTRYAAYGPPGRSYIA